MMTTLRKRGLTLHKSKEKESKEESHLARALLSFDPFSTTLPPLVTESIKYLEEFGLSEEGLFRVPGFQNQVKEMKETYDRGETVDLATAKNVHTVASLLKYYLAELPEPLLTYELMDCFMLGIDVVVREDDNNHENGIEWSLNPTRSCMKLLPPGNRKLLHTLVTFLAKVADNSAVNCMTASNIATCFAPIIIRRELDPTDLATFIKESKKAERFIECTIQHTDYIFATSETESATHPEMKTEFTQHLERGTMTLASNLLKRENTRQQLVGSESDLSRFMSNNHVARGLPKEVSDSISSPHIVDRKPKKIFRGPLVQDVVASPQVTERSRRVPPSRSVNSPRRDSGLIRSAEASGEKEVKLLAQLLLQGKMDDASKLLKEKSQLGILSYEGETNSQGDPHGHGKLLFQNGDIYVGNFVNGERTGKGKITFRNGNHYEGDFVNGLRHGKGVFVDFKGNRYEGQFFQGKRTGFGRLTFAQEDHSYEGNFEDGVPQGFGKTIFSNGDIYEGDHDADERHGFGIFQGKNGGSYEGWYVRGKREGVGYYISKNGSYYKGTFKNNAIHGFGKFIFVSGDSYIGQFRDGKFHGKGIYQFEAGNSVEGLFKDGQPMEDDVQVDSAWIQEELKKATNLRKPDAEFTLTFDRQRFDEA